MIEGPAVPRIVPGEPLPPYAYVPRRGLPHPTTDPAGHSFGRRHAPTPALDPEHWQASQPYLRGFDLLNSRFFWEAHEAWEPLWHACGRRGIVADFLKALIKLAAAGVKHLEEVPGGTATHARRAADLWQGVARSLGEDTDRYLGLRIRELIELARGIAEGGWPETPVILLPRLPEDVA
jgi:hypothetical protein